MKNTVLILCICFINLDCLSQTPYSSNLVQPDLIIGDYGISLKNKTIGRYHIYDCSDENYHAECYGYLKAETINFDTTTLVFIGKEIRFKEDLILDLETLKILDSGNDSHKDSQERDPIYIDKNKAYNGLNSVIDTLYGFKHIEQNYFIKKDTLAYLDTYGFYILNNSTQIDKTTFKPITKNIFYDKNALYYVEYGYSEIKEKKYSDFIKLQNLEPNKNLSVTIKENYCVINGKVYDINRVENELQLDPNNIKELILDDYSGKMLMYDDKTVYESYRKHYRFEKATCETEYEKTKTRCLFGDLNKISTVRKTVFSEYHINLDTKTLYFDADKNLNLTKTSGNLYIIGNSYYFTDNEGFSTQINVVKIWNPEINDYENIDLDKYLYLNNEIYYYKGNVYGNHSKIKQTNFNLKNARALLTDSHYYIANNKQIIGFSESEKLNINSLKVLKTKNKQATNYLVGDTFLIYDNQIIEKINTKTIVVLNKNLLKTDKYFINNGAKIAHDTFPFKTMFIK